MGWFHGVFFLMNIHTGTFTWITKLKTVANDMQNIVNMFVTM